MTPALLPQHTLSPDEAIVLSQILPLLLVVDAAGKIRSVSERTVRLLGYDLDELIGAAILDFVHPDDRPMMQSHITEARAAGLDLESSGRLRNALGVPVSVELRFMGVNGEVWIAGFDVTRYVEAQTSLRHLATHDPLTGLPNRALLADRIGHHISRTRRIGARFSVLMIDLDGFKRINDSLGHMAGDMLLREVAHRLKACVRETDTVSRIAGDEFVVLLAADEAFSNPAVVCQRILGDFAKPFSLGEHQVYLTASIGTSTYPEHADNASGLLSCADAAMYQAKELGKDRFASFHPTMVRPDPKQSVTLETAMFKAVRNGEFMLHYQPIVDTAGMLVGCEALMRWQQAGGRMIPPAEFIALAERNGLIMLLGEYALKAACMQLTRFDEAGLAQSYMSVNVSPRQLRHAHFTRKLEQVLKATAVQPERLVLEITESMLMHEPDLVQKQLSEIRAIGCRISLDDFGTGYSCLAYLQRFPISIIKIDRGFVSGLPSDTAGAAIVSAISSLARALGIQCVAEGVETPEQRDALAVRAVEMFQGYLFSRPVSPNDLIKRYGRGARANRCAA